MKTALGLLALLLIVVTVPAQEISEAGEQQLENMAEVNEVETEDDTYWQQLDYWRAHPLNLNSATESQLQELRLLTPLQMSHLLQYRKLLGKLVSIYELQAIPGWDVMTIRKLLPFVTVSGEETMAAGLWRRFSKGETSVLARYASLLEKTGDFLKPDSAAGHYAGSLPRLLFRYKYNYKNLLQYGVLGDKDAGEQFFAGQQRAGFDFYSAHLFARRLGTLKALALGDFTVNMGQGLIQWQSLAFGKSAAITDVKRQGPVLKPYTSSGEFNFHRGAGITLQKGNWEITAFGSFRKFSATLETDSLGNTETFATTLLTSGYHRTSSELLRRNNLQSIAAGGNIRFNGFRWHVGVNTIQYRFGYPFRSSGKPYDVFAIQGNRWGNYSIDYSYTLPNTHIYGEVAGDYLFNKAMVVGALASPDPSVDVAIVYRNIDKAYQSLFSNAFTENSIPVNENGCYAGIAIRPAIYWQLSAYADFFSFPWLKYRVDAPSGGRDYLVQLSGTPSKKLHWYTRYRYEAKPVNGTSNDAATNIILATRRQSWRTQVSYTVNKEWQLTHRIELVNYNNGMKAKQNGFSTYLTLQYAAKNLTANCRVHYVDTDGYDARIYAYEQDVAYSYSIPIFYEKGVRVYTNIVLNASDIVNNEKRIKHCHYKIYFRMARFFNSGYNSVGNGSDEVRTLSSTEYKLQFLLITF